MSPSLTDFIIPTGGSGTAVVLKRMNRRTRVDYMAIVSYDDQIGKVTLIFANPLKQRS